MRKYRGILLPGRGVARRGRDLTAVLRCQDVSFVPPLLHMAIMRLGCEDFFN